MAVSVASVQTVLAREAGFRVDSNADADSRRFKYDAFCLWYILYYYISRWSRYNFPNIFTSHGKVFLLAGKPLGRVLVGVIYFRRNGSQREIKSVLIRVGVPKGKPSSGLRGVYLTIHGVQTAHASDCAPVRVEVLFGLGSGHCRRL